MHVIVQHSFVHNRNLICITTLKKRRWKSTTNKLFGTCQPLVVAKSNKQKMLVWLMDTILACADCCSVCLLCENKSSLWVVSGHLKVSDGTQA